MHNHVQYHTMSVRAISQQFDVDPMRGLSAAGVLQRRAEFGLNKIGRPETKSSFEILLYQFKSLLMGLLAGAALLSFLFEDGAEAIAILVVIIINAAIGFWAEHKALHSMAALRKIGRATTRVRRDGQIQIIPDEEIVPGDSILLEAGDIITADICLIESTKLQSDESLLTGESVPIDKFVSTLSSEVPLHERSNMVFKGATITRGSCVGIAVSTGTNTELGGISNLAETAKGTVSPLEKRLQKLSEQLLIAVLILTLFLTISGIMVGRDALLMIKTGIALAVAAIPEGLPIVATLALARGMWKLAERHALIERLSAVETLGSVNIIFTDKTGTLTENKMTAQSLVASDAPAKNSLIEQSAAGLRALRVCSLCYSGGDANQLSDPMENALVQAAESAGITTKISENDFPRVSEEAFDPNIRMMATIHDHGENFLYAVKGAPVAVIAAATHIALQQDKILTQDMRTDWLAHVSELASEGMRVLALAEKITDTREGVPFEGLIFLGLIGLEDPPRADAAAAIKSAQDAGVRVIMVTGDNAITGTNIAEAVGIANACANLTVEGTMLSSPEKTSPEIRERLLAASIFARVNPRQKLDLIELHQLSGSVVAMTGDGVNDAPALKKADVGIAMGKRGTEVAKEAADLILKNDDFASIVMAIQQGRVIFNNIRKFVIYLLSCNLSEVLVVTVCILAGLPLPLLPLQILFLNFITDVFPALALGFGKGGSDILNRPPRPKSEGILRRSHWRAIVGYGFVMTAAVIGAFLWALAQPDKGIYYANTIAFLVLALGQLWHVFNMRSSTTTFLNNHVVRNPYIWTAILLCLLLLLAALNWHPLAQVLHITLLDNTDWIVVICASLIPLFVGQVVKAFAGKREVPSTTSRIC